MKKQEKNGRTFTSVTPLDYNEKLREVARLQGGEHITETTLAGAAELSETATRYKETIKS